MTAKRKHSATVRFGSYALLTGYAILLSFSLLHSHNISFTDIQNIGSEQTSIPSADHSLYECPLYQHGISSFCFCDTSDCCNNSEDEQKLVITQVATEKLQTDYGRTSLRGPPLCA